MNESSDEFEAYSQGSNSSTASTEEYDPSEDSDDDFYNYWTCGCKRAIADLYDSENEEVSCTSQKDVLDLSSMSDDERRGVSELKDLASSVMVDNSGGETQEWGSSSPYSTGVRESVPSILRKQTKFAGSSSKKQSSPSGEAWELRTDEKLEGLCDLRDEGKVISKSGNRNRSGNKKKRRLEKRGKNDDAERVFTDHLQDSSRGDDTSGVNANLPSDVLIEEKEYFGFPLGYSTVEEVEAAYYKIAADPPKGFNGRVFLRKALSRVDESKSTGGEKKE